MSGDNIAIVLEERKVIGKGLRKLVAEGKVPAVIHNHGKESIHVMGELMAINKAYHQAGKHHPVQLKVADRQHLALIKDVDFEPTKHRMRHVVFQAIKQNEEVEAEIPVVFAEVEIPAEKKSLLVLKQLDSVQVKALPKNLPNELVVDPGKLDEVGDHLTVADIKLPEGVTILTPEETSIAAVEMPKDQIAEANAIAAEQAEAAGTTDQADDAAEGDTAAAPSEPAEE